MKRAAQRVREWRRLHGEMSQGQFAHLAGISVGCLQGFERSTRKTRDTHLLKIATAIGVTLEDLTREDAPPVPPDPLLADLTREDFRIAYAYHHSGADVKYAVKRFFATSTSADFRERVAVWMARLLNLGHDELTRWELITTGLDYHPSAPAATVPPSRTEKTK